MAKNGKVCLLWGRRMNKVSSRCCKTLFQIAAVIRTRETTEDLQEHEAQHSRRRISRYVLVLITLFSKLGFPIRISTMKEGVFIGVAENFPFPVRFFFFYGLHVMVEGVDLKI